MLYFSFFFTTLLFFVNGLGVAYTLLLFFFHYFAPFCKQVFKFKGLYPCFILNLFFLNNYFLIISQIALHIILIKMLNIKYINTIILTELSLLNLTTFI